MRWSTNIGYVSNLQPDIRSHTGRNAVHTQGMVRIRWSTYVVLHRNVCPIIPFSVCHYGIRDMVRLSSLHRNG
jgi:hypothetical protein